MSIEKYLARVGGGLEKGIASVWAKMTTYADEGIGYMKNLLSVVIPAEVTALAPYAEEALSEAADAVPTLIASLVASGGNAAAGLTAYAAAVGPILLNTAQKAEAAGIKAGAAALHLAIASSIANAAANQAEEAPSNAAAAKAAGVDLQTPGDAVDHGDGSFGPSAADGTGTSS